MKIAPITSPYELHPLENSPADVLFLSREGSRDESLTPCVGRDGEHSMEMNFDEPRQILQRPDLLAGIIGSAMDAIIAIDDAQRVVLFNSAAERVFDCPANEAIGNFIDRFIPKRFRAEHGSHVLRFADSGVTNRTLDNLGTLWGLRTTGEEFPIEASISKLESGGRTFFTVVIRDITERLRAEEAVRESEQRFRLVADTAPVLIWMSGTDMLCTYFNQPWLDFTGRSMEEELGNGWAEGVHPDDLERCLQTYTHSFDRRENFRMEYRLRRNDGEYRWILDIGVPRFNQDRVFAGYIGIGVDVTERKLTEVALGKSEERFRLAAQAGKMFAYEWNVVTDVIARSPEAARILGIDEGAQITGQQIVAQVHPDDRARLTAAVAALSPEKPYLQTSYRMTRPDGTVIWVERNSRADFDEQGRMLRVVGMVADVTDRKLAEEARFKHAAVVESSEDAIISKDLNGTITSWNPGAQNIFGYTESQVIGRPITILIPPDLLAEENKILEKLRAGERIEHYETVRVTETGKKIDVSLTISPIKDSGGNVVGASKIARDITERKRAADALRKSEERFRLAARSGKMYAYEWDVATDLIVRSGDVATVLGSTDEIPLTRQQLLTGVHPDDRTLFNVSVTGLTPEHPDVQISYRILRPDESVMWLEKTAHAFFDERGKMVRMIGMVADITERKVAEKTLHESEERLRLAQQAAGIGTFEWDTRTGTNTWTPQLEAMYGLPPGGFGGTHAAFESLVHVEDRARLREAVDSTLKTGQPTKGEWRVVWPDGSVHWLAAYWQVLMDGSARSSRVIGVNMDITERKRTEEALHESEERFRLAANTAPVMIWMSGEDKKPTYFNQLWQDFTGLSESDLRNRLVSIVHPDDYQRCHDVYRNGFDQRQPFKKEYRLRRHDGQYRWMLDIGVPRFHKDGSFAGYIGSCIDLTDQKLAQEALSEMPRKLVQAHEQERTRIARELHDDINQRLAMLAVELDQMKENPSEVGIRVGELRKQVTDISNDIQVLSHDLHSSQLEYLGVVEGMKSWCKGFGERQGMQIDWSHAVESTLSQEIGLCLFRVLQEALHNATKHSGVKQIKVELSESSGDIHLTIRDLGKGFDPEEVKQGKGLGLTSMRERVRLVSGTITIDSKPMSGTTIRVRVPSGSGKASEQAVA